MRVRLALMAAFCLALPLSASAHLRTEPVCPKGPPLTRQVCLCEVTCGITSHLAFPVSASDVLRGAVHAKMRRGGSRCGTGQSCNSAARVLSHAKCDFADQPLGAPIKARFPF